MYLEEYLNGRRQLRFSSPTRPPSIARVYRVLAVNTRAGVNFPVARAAGSYTAGFKYPNENSNT